MDKKYKQLSQGKKIYKIMDSSSKLKNSLKILEQFCKFRYLIGDERKNMEFEKHSE
jgi:hypothetical protein